jgi:RecA-family ATPase
VQAAFPEVTIIGPADDYHFLGEGTAPLDAADMYRREVTRAGHVFQADKSWLFSHSQGVVQGPLSQGSAAALVNKLDDQEDVAVHMQRQIQMLEREKRVLVDAEATHHEEIVAILQFESKERAKREERARREERERQKVLTPEQEERERRAIAWTSDQRPATNQSINDQYDLLVNQPISDQ